MQVRAMLLTLIIPIKNVIFLIQNIFITFKKVVEEVCFVVRNVTLIIFALGYLFKILFDQRNS